MADNIQRSTGTPKNYKLDRGGVPLRLAVYEGEVRNNIDPTRSGRMLVWIEEFAGPDKNDSAMWTPVSYASPFYGVTEQLGTDQGVGSYVGNSHSYGFWSTPPDIGTKVLCLFVNGDPNRGYYFASAIEPGRNQMVPAIGASNRYTLENDKQKNYFGNAVRLPVVEINDNNEALSQNPEFFNEDKPIHSFVAGVMLQQGVITDRVRGPISSSSQRESPSRVFGLSTPGRPIYRGGLTDEEIRDKLEIGAVSSQDVQVVARRGGHSIVLDDGDLDGNDQLIRIRTAKGHQIMLSDSGDSLHIMHANGQSWMELGSEGTVDVYASNSINLRSQGDINLHADRNINLNSRFGSCNLAGDRAVIIESAQVQITGTEGLVVYSDQYVGIKSDGTLSLKGSKTGTFDGGDNLILSAGCIALNSGRAPDVPNTTRLNRNSLPDVTFENDRGWIVQNGALESIVSRAPTHEPYPLHNRGINAVADLDAEQEEVVFPTEIQDRLADVQSAVIRPISAKEYDTQTPAKIPIGTIDPDQVTGMLAQASFQVNQNFNVISDDKGVGKYGFTAQQLENAGYLKPGTVEFYIQDGVATEKTILESPSVWTGQAGASSVASFLSDEKLQDLAQQDLYRNSLIQLRRNGIVTGQEKPEQLAGFVQAGSKYSPTTIRNWIKQDPEINATLNNDISVLVRGGQYGVELANQKISEARKGLSTNTNQSTSTVSRSNIDTAVTDVLGDPKIPGPNYNASSNSSNVKVPVPSVRRRIQSNGVLTNANVDPSEPFIDIVVLGVLTRVYGSFELLTQYYPTANVQVE